MHDGRSFEPARVKGPGGPDLRPMLMVFLVGLVLVVAKPWEGLPSGGGPSRLPVSSGRVTPDASGGAAGPPSPDPSPPPQAPVSDLCLDPAGWRTVSYEAWHDQQVRVWRAVTPGPASGPDDPLMPEILVSASALPALGWCAPVSGPERPAGPAVADWWLVEDGVAPIRLAPVRLLPLGQASPFGAIYAPPVRSCGEMSAGCPLAPSDSLSDDSWRPGRYVLRYHDVVAQVDRWLAIQVETLTLP